MALRKDAVDKVQSEDIDECKFFINYIYDKEIINNHSIRGFDGPSHICQYINDELNYFFNGNVKEINSFISDMLYNLPDNNLIEEDTEWFTSNRRACLWLWAELYCIDDNEINLLLMKSRNPGIHNERVEEIIKKLNDRYNSRNRKKRTLNQLKEKWSVIFNEESFFNFLPKDDEDICMYVWKYLCSDEYGINGFYSPITQEERFLSIINYFDFIVDSIYQKELVAGKIKSALDQRKHRKKKSIDSVSKRFYIKNKNLDKLEMVLLNKKMSTDEYFNTVIELDYSNLDK